MKNIKFIFIFTIVLTLTAISIVKAGNIGVIRWTTSVKSNIDNVGPKIYVYAYGTEMPIPKTEIEVTLQQKNWLGNYKNQASFTLYVPLNQKTQKNVTVGKSKTNTRAIYVNKTGKYFTGNIEMGTN